MRKTVAIAWTIYGVLLAAMIAQSAWMIFDYAPIPFDKSLGANMPIHKMFYVHVPFAINAFVAALLAFVGGIGFLWQRKMKWDDFSSASAGAAAALWTVVLVTGMIWARYAWGAWWAWTPKLTSALLMWLLYVVYLVLRPSIESRQRRALVCAVYAVAAFLDAPLVYLSSKLMPDMHPSNISLGATAMKLTFVACIIAAMLLMVGLVVGLTVRNRKARTRAEAAAAADSSWSLTDGEPTRQ